MILYLLVRKNPVLLKRGGLIIVPFHLSYHFIRGLYRVYLKRCLSKALFYLLALFNFIVVFNQINERIGGFILKYA